MKNLCLIFILACLHTSIQAQIPTKNKESTTGSPDQDKALVEQPENATYFLSLEKGGRKKRLRFYTGDKITITFKGMKEKFTPTITKITANRVEVADAFLDLSTVHKITLYNRGSFKAKVGSLLPAAGLLYFLGDMINPIFSGREAFQIKKGSIIVPATLIGTGLLLRALSKRTLKMNKNRYLRIMEKI